MKRTLLIGLLLATGLFCALPANAQTAPTETAKQTSPADEAKTAEIKRAVAVIQKAEQFALGGVGVVGRLTDVEIQTHILIKRKAKGAFLALAKDENLVARLYALVGLRYLKCPEAKPLAQELATSKATVQHFQGCILGGQKVAALTKEITDGENDAYLKATNDRLDDILHNRAVAEARRKQQQ